MIVLKICMKITKIIKNIKNGVIIIFIYHIEMSQEVLEEYFLIMKLKLGKNFKFVRDLGFAFIHISKK